MTSSAKTADSGRAIERRGVENRGIDDRLSLPQEFARGLERGAEDLAGGVARTVKAYMPSHSVTIGAENERAFVAMLWILVSGRTNGPLRQLVQVFAAEHLRTTLRGLPGERLAEFAGSVARGTAAKFAGKYLFKKVATALASRIAIRVEAVLLRSVIVRELQRRLGLYTAAGVAPPIGLLLFQGVLERASEASQRLRGVLPVLHKELVAKNLDMLFFLVEDQLPEIYEHGADFLRQLGLEDQLPEYHKRGAELLRQLGRSRSKGDGR